MSLNAIAIPAARGPGPQDGRRRPRCPPHAAGWRAPTTARPGVRGTAHAEVIVDTTTLIVLGGLGLDVSGETIPYVAAGASTARWTPSPSSPRSSTRAQRVQAALSNPGGTQQIPAAA